MSETCDPSNPLQLIAKVQTAPNNTNDDDLLIEAVPSLKQRLDIDEVHTDGGYNSDESYQALRENAIKHVQTAIRGHAASAHLGLDQFEIATTDQDVHLTVPSTSTTRRSPAAADVLPKTGRTAAICVLPSSPRLPP